MVSVKGNYDLNDAKTVASGTGKFLKSFQPKAIQPPAAKDLMLKDAEYSTPQDHYFAHISSKKEATLSQEDEIRAAREAQVMKVIFDADEDEVQAVDLAIEMTAEQFKAKERTFSQMVRGLSDEERAILLKRSGMTEEQLA